MAFYLDFESVKDIHVLSVLIWDFRGCLRFLTWVWLPDLNLDVVFGLCHTNSLNFDSLSWFWKCKERSMSFKSWFWALEDAGGSWQGIFILILIWVWSLVFETPMVQILIYIFILKVQRTSMSFKSCFGALDDAGGSWLEFDILIFIWIWSLVFDTLLCQISPLYLDYEGAKKIHVL